MPPKKKVEDEKPLLGRFGTSLTIGVVGLPNVGKSTFFNCMTKQAAAAENYPFCTIEPNESRCPVPDPRFDWLCDFHKPASKVPAFLNITDIAGLVQGAHSGAGLGNAFLSHIKATDGIFQMVRCFENGDVTHIEGDVDPIRDMTIIHEELRLKDVETLEKAVEALQKVCRSSSDKTKKSELEILLKIQEFVTEQKKDARLGTWNAKEIEVLNSLLLITAKPVIYLTNLTEADFIRKKNKWLPKVKEFIEQRNSSDLLIPVSMEFELKLSEMTPEQKDAYEKEVKCTSILPKIVKAGYQALQLQNFFTCGPGEVRAWTIRKGDKAPTAAGKIHSDFEKGFIMAEVMKYEDFKELGSETAVKAKGKYRQEGKNYVVEDGDIIFFKFNAGAGLAQKKK